MYYRYVTALCISSPLGCNATMHTLGRIDVLFLNTFFLTHFNFMFIWELLQIIFTSFGFAVRNVRTNIRNSHQLSSTGRLPFFVQRNDF